MSDFKSKLDDLRNNEKFNKLIKQLVLDQEIKEFQDKSFILSCAIILLKYVDNTDKRNNKLEQLKKQNDIQYKNQKSNTYLQNKIKNSDTSEQKKSAREEFKNEKAKLEQEIKQRKKMILSDIEYKLCIELAYYIIVKYSLVHSDYKPLYDFSINFGYYPISRFIFKHIWSQDELSFNHIMSDIYVSGFEDGDKVLIYQQQKYTEELLQNDSLYKAYIAPTSYGKSEFISELIKHSQDKKIIIISPTKLLVRQNGNVVKDSLKGQVASEDKKYKIIYHHDMFNKEKNKDTNIIASFTQERGLRFLKEHHTESFDFIIIDEAHELFKNDGRSHLLEIFKQKNQKRNPNQKILFLSPVVNDPNKFIINDEHKIFSKKIKYSLKEPELYYYKDMQGYKYNRFLDEKYEIKTYQDELDYIKNNSLKKNLVFLTNPRDIEKYAQRLIEISVIDSEKLNNISQELAKQVHEDFYLVDCIKKGIAYIHGKLPDDIREYIVSKFKNENPEDNIPIKYLVANTVVLSGVNFPIDNLFILKLTTKQSKNDLINLIGRINRLNYIFNTNNKSLEKLLTPVHFISSVYDNNSNYKLIDQMKKLRSIVFEDKIKNDLIKDKPEKGKKTEANFQKELDRYNKNHKKLDMIVETEYNRRKNEELVSNHIEQLIYIYDLQNLYHNVEERILEIFDSIKNIDKTTLYDSTEEKVMDLIYLVFFEQYENMIYKEIFNDHKVGRLRKKSARNYYIGFIKSQRNSLKSRIRSQVEYYEKLAKSFEYDDYMIYVGPELGELPYESEIYSTLKKVYINIKAKEPVELVNITISKINIEDDYVSFHLHKFFGFLFDVDLLTTDEYNELVYGSNDEDFIHLVTQGLPISMVHRLSEDNIMEHIKITDYNIKGNEEYKKYHIDQKSKSDFYAFMLDQYIEK